MALTLDTTSGGQFANSYVDVAYCDEYWANHYSQTKADLWSSLTDNQKVSVLISACNVIERYKYTEGYFRGGDYYDWKFNRNTGTVVQLSFDGRPLRSTYLQKLQFPRNLDYMDDGTFYVPEPVKMAQCEQAAYLLAFDESTIANRMQGIINEKTDIGNGAISTSQTIAQGGTALSPVAKEFLSPFFVVSNSWKRS